MPSSGQAQTQDCAIENSLRSATTGVAVELSFRNASGERKRLYWLDYDGQRKFYTVVEPGNVYRQQTSSGHAWVVADDIEKCQTLVVAPASPTTVDIGGASTAQAAPPVPGVQQPIQQPIQQPVAQAPVAQPVQPAPPPVVPAPQPTATAPEAPQQAMAAAPLPQISPVEQFQLSGPYRVAARSEAGKFLNAQGSGGVEVARVKPEWDSTQWAFEAVPGTPFVRIKSRWKNTYLTDVNGTLRATNATPDADEAHWTFEPVDGTSFVQFRNRETDRFLLANNNAAALAEDYRQDQETQTHWQVDPATRAAAAAVAPRNAAYDSALLNCRQIGGYWTGSSCRAPQATIRLSCGPGWVWAPDIGECLWDGGGRCPPWQLSPSGACLSDLACRGGLVRISGRGYPVCDCPLGTVTWGNYPNLSCVPSVARVLPLIIGPGVTPGFQGRPRVGQGFGSKTFGPGGLLFGGSATITANPARPAVIPAVGGTPPQTTPVVNTPAVGKPVVNTPAVGTPVVNTPAVGTPVVNTPAAGTPVVNTPTAGTPVRTGPLAPCAPWQTGAPGACVDKKVVCVGGTVEQGYCRCSQGFVPSGFNDNFTCQAQATAACPAGSTGTPPNCRPTATTTTTTTTTTTANACGEGANIIAQRCNCVAPLIARSDGICGRSGTAAAPQTCAAGQTGSPPNCVTAAAATPNVAGPPLCTAGQNTASGCRCAPPLTLLPAGRCDRPTLAGAPCLEGQNVAQTQCKCQAPLKMIEGGVCGRLALNETRPLTKGGNCAEGQDIKATSCMCLMRTVDMGGGRFVCSATAAAPAAGGGKPGQAVVPTGSPTDAQKAAAAAAQKAAADAAAQKAAADAAQKAALQAQQKAAADAAQKAAAAAALQAQQKAAGEAQRAAADAAQKAALQKAAAEAAQKTALQKAAAEAAQKAAAAAAAQKVEQQRLQAEILRQQQLKAQQQQAQPTTQKCALVNGKLVCQ